jgi:peptidyl-prolyl cis-trans isomerase SurA
MLKICKPFCLLALLLVGTISHAKTLDDVAAVVNDDVITQVQLNRQVALIRQNLAKQHTPLPSNELLRKQILEHMISLSLQKQLAEKFGMKVSAAEVDQAIANIAASQHLSVDRLKTAVAADGISFATFRQQIGEQILIQRVQQAALQDKVKITEQEIDDYLQVLKTQPSTPKAYHIQDILVALPEAPTSEQIQAAKQQAEKILQRLQQGANFDQVAVGESAGEEALQRGDLGWRKLAELPGIFAERVKNLSAGAIAGPIRADNGFHVIKVADVKGGVNTKHYTDQLQLRQIFLKPDPSFPAKVYKEKLQALKNQLQRGADFTQLAENYSEDPVTASKGGDMGWVDASMVSPYFMAQVANLKAGQISQPFQTPAGWYLVQVLAHKKVENTVAYDREQVRAMIYQRKFSEALQSWLQQLRSSSYVKIIDKP